MKLESASQPPKEFMQRDFLECRRGLSLIHRSGSARANPSVRSGGIRGPSRPGTMHGLLCKKARIPAADVPCRIARFARHHTPGGMRPAAQETGAKLLAVLSNSKQTYPRPDPIV